MKRGWQAKKLSALYQIGSSKRVLKSQWKTEGVPFYRGREITRLAADGFVDNELFVSEEHFTELSKEYGVPKAGDIVITAIGTIGNTHVVRDSDRFYFKDASVLWMKRTAEVSSEFINLWLKSPLFFDQLDRGNGATVDTLTIQKLQGVEIDFPPLPEQQRIVGILDEAFEGLATAKANAETNLHNARALFESHLQFVFTQRGEGWEQHPLVSVCALFVDSAHRTPKYQDEGIPALRPRDVVNGKLNLEGALRVSEEEYAVQSKRHKPSQGDIVYSRELSYGWAALLPKVPRVCLSQGMCLFRPSSKLDAAFLLYVLNGSIGREQATRAAVGASHPHINLSDIKAYVIPVAPLGTQRQIVQQLNALSAETQRLAALYQRKLAVLEALKKSLLHQAFAGQL